MTLSAQSSALFICHVVLLQFAFGQKTYQSLRLTQTIRNCFWKTKNYQDELKIYYIATATVVARDVHHFVISNFKIESRVQIDN